MDAYIAMIMPWPLSWAPVGWLICDGTLLPVSGYQALFALIGTTYGGNGSTNFALPDLRGQVILGVNQNNGVYPLNNLGVLIMSLLQEAKQLETCELC